MNYKPQNPNNNFNRKFDKNKEEKNKPSYKWDKKPKVESIREEVQLKDQQSLDYPNYKPRPYQQPQHIDKITNKGNSSFHYPYNNNNKPWMKNENQNNQVFDSSTNKTSDFNSSFKFNPQNKYQNRFNNEKNHFRNFQGQNQNFQSRSNKKPWFQNQQVDNKPFPGNQANRQNFNKNKPYYARPQHQPQDRFHDKRKGRNDKWKTFWEKKKKVDLKPIFKPQKRLTPLMIKKLMITVNSSRSLKIIKDKEIVKYLRRKHHERIKNKLINKRNYIAGNWWNYTNSLQYSGKIPYLITPSTHLQYFKLNPYLRKLQLLTNLPHDNDEIQELDWWFNTKIMWNIIPHMLKFFSFWRYHKENDQRSRFISNRKRNVQQPLTIYKYNRFKKPRAYYFLFRKVKNLKKSVLTVKQHKEFTSILKNRNKKARFTGIFGKYHKILRYFRKLSQDDQVQVKQEHKKMKDLKNSSSLSLLRLNVSRMFKMKTSLSLRKANILTKFRVLFQRSFVIRRSFKRRFIYRRWIHKRQKHINLSKPKSRFLSYGLIPPFKLITRQSSNNIFLTALSSFGKIISTFSSGIVGITGSSRSTAFACDQVGRTGGSHLTQIGFGPSLLFFKSPLNRHIKSLVRSVSFRFKKIKGFCDLIPRSHNGLRGRKLRRV